jgi:hypothetical protein
MAAIITSQTAFGANEQITSAKLNNILAQSSFDTGALTGDGTLSLVSGQMQVSILKTANLPASIINQTMIGTNVVGNGPAFRAYASTETSIGTQVHTQVNLVTELFDTNSNFANSRFTPTVAGYYLISGQIFTTVANTGLLASIAKNGIQHSYGSQIAGSSLRSVVSDIVYLNGTTDYVALNAYSGGAVTIQTSGGIDTYFSGCLIRSA